FGNRGRTWPGGVDDPGAMQTAIGYSGFNDACYGWFSIYDQVTPAGKVAHITRYCRHRKGTNRTGSLAFAGLRRTDAAERRLYPSTTAARNYAADQNAAPYAGFDHLN